MMFLKKNSFSVLVFSFFAIILTNISCTDNKSKKENASEVEKAVSYQYEVVSTADADISNYDIAIGKSELNELPNGPIEITDLNSSHHPKFQLEDWDQDGQWDSLYFQVNVKSNETVKLTIASSDDRVEKTNQTPLTQVYLGKFDEGKRTAKPMLTGKRLDTMNNAATQKQYQFEGPGWENDKIAFRNYFDARNGIDIFGKQEATLVLDKVGVEGNYQDYHKLQDWGLDILKVGNSLGCGSIALMYEDSIFRLSAKDADFKVLFNLPLRSALELNFRKLTIGSSTINIKHIISIAAGNYHYDNQIIFSQPVEGLAVVTGIVKHGDLKLQSSDSEHTNSFFTYGKQSIENRNLGMGISFPSSELLFSKDIQAFKTSLNSTHAFGLKPNGKNVVIFTTVAGWELSKDQVTDYQGFVNYMHTLGKRGAVKVNQMNSK